jgi:hypothetical protein
VLSGSLRLCPALLTLGPFLLLDLVATSITLAVLRDGTDNNTGARACQTEPDGA